MSKYEYRMMLGESTNTLQNWCHDGYANKPVELMIVQNGRRVYMARPLLTERVVQDPHSITLVVEDKEQEVRT